MKKIGLLSDTHNYLDDQVFTHFEFCDEIWHAGDVGSVLIAQQLKQGLSCKEFTPEIRGVYGNIDGQDVKSLYPEQLVFMCEGVKVLMRHIGGTPPNYNRETKKALMEHQPRLFICGHSHILKIIFDEKIQCLYMNPGAAGKHGWQKVRTILRFEIDGKEMKNCEVIELGSR